VEVNRTNIQPSEGTFVWKVPKIGCRAGMEKVDENCRNFHYQWLVGPKILPLHQALMILPTIVIIVVATVDGRNPANQLRLVVEIPLFLGF